MIRLVFGWIFIAAAALVWFAEQNIGSRAAASAAYAVLALPLIYYGRRARRRGKVVANKETTPGDVAGIRDKLARGASPKDKNKALNKAAYAGHIDAVREILASGVDVNATLMFQYPPLLAAIHGGHPEIAELLLDHGVSLTNKEDENPLIVAVQRARTEIVELLLRRGIDVNAANEKGMTALMYAAQNGEAELVRMLLAAGADPNLEDKFGYTALALVGGNLTLGKKPDVSVELIEGGADMSGRFFPHKISFTGGVDRHSPIQWATATGMRDKEGNTMLMIAAAKGRRRAVHRLLSDVPVDAVNLAGQTAADVAEAAGHSDVAAGLRQAVKQTVNA